MPFSPFEECNASNNIAIFVLLQRHKLADVLIKAAEDAGAGYSDPQAGMQSKFVTI